MNQSGSAKNVDLPPSMSDKEKIQVLKKVDFLSIFHESTLERLAQESREIYLKENEILFSEGDSGNTMFIILKGDILIFRGEKKLTVLLESDYFGEMALIETKPRAAGARAVTSALLIEITETQFRNYFAAQPQALLALLKTLSSRIREISNPIHMDHKFLEGRESSAHYAQKLDSSAIETYVIEKKTFRILKANALACENTGYSMGKITQMTFMELGMNFTPESLEHLFQPLLSKTRSVVVVETLFQRKDGTAYPVEVNLQLSDLEAEQGGIIAWALDLSERKQLEETIRQMAYYDVLTGLPNRNLLNDRLEVALAHATRRIEQVAILFLDLDHFKTINDSMGHDMGDLILQEVGKRLQNAVRKEDTVARMGGDEFIIITLGILNSENLGNLAQKILDSLSTPYIINENEFFISCSIGISVFPDDGLEVKSLLKNADMAMYQAKEKGRNTYQLFTPALNKKAMHRMTMEKHLRKALEKGEFKLEYQPKISLTTGRITGIEALVRWNSSELGELPPNEFIPVAEETQIILPLGEWVLTNACRKIKKWMDADYSSASVSVNLSVVQFTQGSLLPFLKEVLDHTKIDPELLELEIKEGFYVRNTEAALEILKNLRKIGVRLAIDDFGSGYSSFTYLRELPVNSLKIDGSIIKDFSLENISAITRAIVTLGRNLKLKTIAEGVETEEQKKFLQEIKCDEAQGYLFSKPLSEEGIEELLREDKKFF